MSAEMRTDEQARVTMTTTTITRKRNRSRTSCKPCGSRHIKCNLTVPCFPCIQRGCEDQCKVDNPSLSKAAKQQMMDKVKKTSLVAAEVVQSSNKETEIKEMQGISMTVTEDHPARRKSEEELMQAPTNPPFYNLLQLTQKALGEAELSKNQAQNESLASSAYPLEVQKELNRLQECLPLKKAYLRALMYRCLSLELWAGGMFDRTEIGNLCKDKAGQSSVSSQNRISNDDKPFGRFDEVGDAARLALVMAMVLSTLTISSTRLFTLCYAQHPKLRSEIAESPEMTRSRLLDMLEADFNSIMEISFEHDVGSNADNLVRAGLMHIYYLKNRGFFHTMKMGNFVRTLNESVRRAELHRVDDTASSLSETKLNARKALFYAYLERDQMASAAFGKLPFFVDGEYSTKFPANEPAYASVHYKVKMAAILTRAREIMTIGPSSQSQIENFDTECDAVWKEFAHRCGSIEDNAFKVDTRYLMDACIRQLYYSTCRIMFHRQCIFGAPADFPSEAVSRSVRVCLDAATLSVEALEVMRITMQADEVMGSFFPAWLPTEHVVTLLLISLMALRKELANHSIVEKTKRSERDLRAGEEACHAAIKMVECAHQLAHRCKRCLESAMPESVLPDMSLQMLNRIYVKTNVVLSSEISSYLKENKAPIQGISSNFTSTDSSAPINIDDHNLSLPFFQRQQSGRFNSNTASRDRSSDGSSGDSSSASKSLPFTPSGSEGDRAIIHSDANFGVAQGHIGQESFMDFDFPFPHDTIPITGHDADKELPTCQLLTSQNEDGVAMFETMPVFADPETFKSVAREDISQFVSSEIERESRSPVNMATVEADLDAWLSSFVETPLPLPSVAT